MQLAARVGQLAAEYGIGRRYRLEPKVDWYYARKDLDKIKDALQEAAAAEARAKSEAPAGTEEPARAEASAAAE